jgi:hypothetical protein
MGVSISRKPWSVIERRTAWYSSCRRRSARPEAHARRLVHVDLVFDGERRRCRAIEQPDLVHDHLDLARGQVGVDRIRRATLHDAPHQDHVLGAQLTRAIVTLR